MASPETSSEATASETEQDVQLESGAYEILRNRLREHGQELRQRLDRLNAARKDVFGAIATTLLATERITTENNCVPRDLVSVGDKFLFGYNVHLGLKSETHLEDVFASYEFRDNTFHTASLSLLADERFQREFGELYKYYKDARFAKFFVRDPHLYMVFRVGESVSDIKCFKWLLVDDQPKYVDSRSDHEVQFPPQHEFEWIRTTRDMHSSGVHPHISIEDRVFVETVGGDLTIKIENNTDTGEGIYAEPVDNADQTLDDALIYYAIVGNLILLKIRPYQEQAFRYIVYNEKMQEARRIDAIEHACVLLPDGHGLIFSNGYYLQNGEHKTFEHQTAGMLFERRVASPNGEDYLYVFYNRLTGVYVLLRYNVIEQSVDTPLICSGSSLFDAGELVCFRSPDKPEKHHALQIWQTPYVGPNFVPPTNTDSQLFKIGNRDIVRGMSECRAVLALIDKDEAYAEQYIDIAKQTNDILDSFFWINDEDAFKLSEPLREILTAASAAIDEFEKVRQVRAATSQQTRDTQSRTQQLLASISHSRFETIDEFVGAIGDLRAIRGAIISLKDLRYADHPLIESLEDEVVEQSDVLAQRCVEFLLGDTALKPYQDRIAEQSKAIEGLQRVADAKGLLEVIDQGARELEMLIEIVGNLKIDDATQRTSIIDDISAIFGTINGARASIKSRIQGLVSVEGIAEFGSQMKLLDQSVVSYIDLCDSPEKCEELLTKILVQIEELEGRFAEFDDFVVQLSEKRDEVYNAFESRKLALVEKRNRRASSIASAADRILKGIQSRVERLDDIEQIHSYFASDLMIDKVRDLIRQLQELEDTVKVDDIQSRLKTVKEDAIRQLKDRRELFSDGDNLIKLGAHQFTVNVQALDLTTVLRDENITLHLTGTNFFEPLVDEQLEGAREVWGQEVVSENDEVYRGEYLARLMFEHLQANQELLASFQHATEEERAKSVQQFMGPRYQESYVKGVTDHDASAMLHELLKMNDRIGLLRYQTQARACARVFWEHFMDQEERALMTARLQGVALIEQVFPHATQQYLYTEALRQQLSSFVDSKGLFDASLVDEAARYLFAELARPSDGRPFGSFCVSRVAADACDAFGRLLRHSSFDNQYAHSIEPLSDNPAARFQLIRGWVEAFLPTTDTPAEYRDEIAAALMQADNLAIAGVEGQSVVDGQVIVDGQVTADLSGLLGVHSTIKSGNYALHFNHFMAKLDKFVAEAVPRYTAFQHRKTELVDAARKEMRLDEFKPRVLTSFVRNKLIDTVYLPLIGDNLAKQIGSAGESKRTDRMGLLLLVSPPGYGKTTLMEYLANRLGIIFMKINGPAIGHQVTSLDPSEASNAAAREEVEKLNLSLEMGDNVMIYLDDIQHCNPEFLQRFISLCDATRKIEGVYKGHTRTYDLRGRKVVVVMAGNPYTESGERFQIPDMLSNRADIYNLGEIIGDSAKAFEMSYLENCLTSNPTLSRLASRSQKDVYAFLKIAETDEREGVEFEGSYSSVEVEEFVSTLRKLMTVRDVILKVNRQYVASAAQSDDYRTEPPFKLQGSYRNMNRIAEKVVPIMNDAELQSLILSSYENDAQTLTSDTESNLLKLRELLGILTADEAARWESIKRTYSENVKMKGIDQGDPIGQVVGQLRSFNEGLYAIKTALAESAEVIAENKSNDRLLEHAQEQENRRMESEQERASLLVERISEVGSGLASIQEAIERGLKKLHDTSKKQLASEDRKPAGADDATVAAAIQAMQELASELSELTSGTLPIDPSQPTRVSVSHRVPKSILGVIESQFELMKDSIAPLLISTEKNSKSFEELKDTFQQSLEHTTALLNELYDARKKQSKGRSKS